MDSYHREYEFSLSSILSFVWRGIVVGCVSGIVVSLFRLLIGFISAKVVNYYELSHEQPSFLIPPLVKSSATSLLITRVPEVKLFGLAQTKYLRFYTCEVV